jgi:hypothetical protein
VTLADFIRTEARDESRSPALAASLAGAANAGIMYLVNGTASSTHDDRTRPFVMIGLAVALVAIYARRTFHRTTAPIESALQKIKLRINRTDSAQSCCQRIVITAK